MTLYRGFDAETLEREYSPSSVIGGDYMPFARRYVAESEAARGMPGVQEDLSYGPGKAQVLDYFPAGTPGAPLHVFIHGGYWQELSQKESAAMAPGIIAAGSAFVTLNYTLAPRATLSEIVDEIALAFHWLSANSDELGFDRQRITLSGHSAGAHLAAMMLSRSHELSIERLILISGVFDLTPIPDTSVNDALRLDRDDVLSLSPMMLQPVLKPAVDIVVAERDTAEFRRQSRDYYRYLLDACIPATFREIAGLNHFDIILEPSVFST